MRDVVGPSFVRAANAYAFGLPVAHASTPYGADSEEGWPR